MVIRWNIGPDVETAACVIVLALAGCFIAWHICNVGRGLRWPREPEKRIPTQPEPPEPKEDAVRRERERMQMIKDMERMARQQTCCFACKYEDQPASSETCITCYTGTNFVSKYRRDK